MHLGDDARRGASIRALVLRFFVEDDTETREFLEVKLQVPSEWLDEALAYAAGYSFQHGRYCEKIREATLGPYAEHAFSRFFAPTGLYDGGEHDVKEFYTKCLSMRQKSYSVEGGGAG